MSSVPNLHAIEVVYFGPTNYRGSRVKLLSELFEDSVWIDYDHRKNNTWVWPKMPPIDWTAPRKDEDAPF